MWALRGEHGLKAPAAWNISTGSHNIRVGIIDSGIALHDDLNANLDIYSGWNFAENSANWQDTHSHGTRTAGIVGAVGNNGIGTVGVTWNVTLIPMKVSVGNDGPLDYAMILAIREAIELWETPNEIAILTMSISGYGTDAALKSAIISFPGLFVWSAGNHGDNLDTYTNISSYSSLPNLIAVGAIDENGERSIWNSTSSSAYSLSSQHVHVFAPGSNGYTTSLNNAYQAYSGTSMAAPHVAGVAALMLSINPTLSASELKSLLIYNADIHQMYIPAPYGSGEVPINIKKLNAHKAVLGVPWLITQNTTVMNPELLSGRHIIVRNGATLTIQETMIESPEGSITVEGAGSQAIIYSSNHSTNVIGSISVAEGGVFGMLDSQLNIIDGNITVSSDAGFVAVDSSISIFNSPNFANSINNIDISDQATFILSNSTLEISDGIITISDQGSLYVESTYFTMVDTNFIMNDSNNITFSGSIFTTVGACEIMGAITHFTGNPFVDITLSDEFDIDPTGDRLTFFNSLFDMSSETTIKSLHNGGKFDGLFFHSTVAKPLEVIIRGGSISGLHFIRAYNYVFKISDTNISGITQMVLRNGSLFADAMVYEANVYGISVQGSAAQITNKSQIINNGHIGLIFELPSAGISKISDSIIANNQQAGILVRHGFLVLEKNTILDNNGQFGYQSLSLNTGYIIDGTTIKNHDINISAPGNRFPIFNGMSESGYVPLRPHVPDSPTTSFLLQALPPISSIIDVSNLRIPTFNTSHKFDPHINDFEFGNNIIIPDPPFEEALTHLIDEEFLEAKEIFMYIIEEFPDSPQALQSISILPIIFKALEIDYAELLSYFDSLVEEELQLTILQALSLTFMLYEEYESAIYQLDEVINSPEIDTVSQLLAVLDQSLCALLLQNDPNSRAMHDFSHLPSSSSDYRILQEEIFAQIYNFQTEENDLENDTPKIESLTISNYPNPFNPETTIIFSLPNSGNVSLDIFNIRGQKIRTLVNESMNAGHHQVVWNGTDDFSRNVSSGIYFYRINAGGESLTRRMLLLK